MTAASDRHVSILLAGSSDDDTQTYCTGYAVTASGTKITGTTGSHNGSTGFGTCWIDFASIPHGVNCTYNIYVTTDNEREYATPSGAAGFEFLLQADIGNAFTGGTQTGTLNNLTIQYVAATLAEARGLRKTFNLSVPGVQTTTTLAAIGDAWLYDHLRAQFRGNITTTGPTAIRQHATGDPVHPSRLLLQAGELIRLNDRIDPDTGQVGRDARIASVSYDHEAESCTLELDNRRENLQALLARLGTV